MRVYDALKIEIGSMEGYFLAALTDKYIVGEWPKDSENISNLDKALEIRVFNEYREVKLFRGDIGREFKLRTIDDRELEGSETCFDQTQFLDINTKVSPEGEREVQTTGGGFFYLPIRKTEDAKIRIRYYLTKDPDSGMSKVSDWRAVGFEEARNGL